MVSIPHIPSAYWGGGNGGVVWSDVRKNNPMNRHFDITIRLSSVPLCVRGSNHGTVGWDWITDEKDHFASDICIRPCLSAASAARTDVTHRGNGNHGNTLLLRCNTARSYGMTTIITCSIAVEQPDTTRAEHGMSLDRGCFPS